MQPAARQSYSPATVETAGIRTSSVAERLAETTRNIAFGESLSKAMMPKTR